MKTSVAINELERMTPDELQRELRLKRADAAGQRMGLELGKDKDSAKYKALRRDIARMTMVLDNLRAKKGTVAKADKTASKVEKNPVQDSAPKKAPKSSSKAAVAKK
jgi:ribosomal protein L29